MAKVKKPGKADSAADPDKLIRQRAGSYRTSDDRFEVQQGGTGWFVVDSAQSNEFGQPLVLGPFPTMTEVRDALPEARRTALKPLSVSKPAKKAAAKGKPKPKPPPPPPSWIDQLPEADAAAVRALIAALEREGVPDAEQVVRRDRGGPRPLIAEQLIARRLAGIAEELAFAEHEATRQLIRRIVDILTADGHRVPSPLPGWSVVEIGPQPEPPNRRITVES